MTESGKHPDTILVIEDEPAHAELLKIHLSGVSRWLVRIATSLEEFGELFKSINPSIIIADINLPDGSSLSLLENNYNLPILIMTSYADPDIEGEIIKSGAAGFFIKSPETFRNINSIVEEHLRKWNQQHEVQE